MFSSSDHGVKLRSKEPASAALSYCVEAWTVTDCDPLLNDMPRPGPSAFGSLTFWLILAAPIVASVSLS